MISKHVKNLANILITSLALLLSGNALAESPATIYKHGWKLDV